MNKKVNKRWNGLIDIIEDVMETAWQNGEETNRILSNGTHTTNQINEAYSLFYVIMDQARNKKRRSE
tara:strand:+ start:2428 stop:2628 length:201 start_codon:yes stop_codon:yes gene_type:complete